MSEKPQSGTALDYKPKDFSSDQDVRWCPGCGDYSILSQVQKVFSQLAIPREQVVWVSGIGCSSRFPYYMNTYGFHTIHGRAPALAAGLKLNRPDLEVWVATGDGDLLSIGGNHFIHAARRNYDIKLLLFNNKIYGLTKGQYSPTSEKGKVTKSTPYGSIDTPFNPMSLALGASCSFIARSVDRFTSHLQSVLKRAHEHNGFAFVEIFQNCNVFNDGAWAPATDKSLRDDNVLFLEHGKPMIFGKEQDKGIHLNGLHPEVIDLKSGGWSADDCLIHDEFDYSPVRDHILAHLSPQNGFPYPVGVIRQLKRPTYDEDFWTQIEEIKNRKGQGDLGKLLLGQNHWEVS